MRTLRIPFAESDRWGLAALVASSLVALGGCSKSEEGITHPNPNEVASQAQAAQSAIVSAQAAHGEHGRDAMPMQADAGAAPANLTSTGNEPPMNMGAPMAAMGKVRILGQAPATNAAGGLPPALGAPHLYQIGAEDFFLQQASAIGLTPEQQAKLSAIKEKADLAYAATQHKIDVAENDLWTLTSDQKPDATKIDAKISEIGQLGAQQRMDYVRAIGSAVAVLNHDQHKAVVALGPASMPPAAPSSPMNMGTAPPDGGMQMGGGKMKMRGSKMKMGGASGMEHGGMPMKAPMTPKGKMPPMGAMPDEGSSQGMGHM